MTFVPALARHLALGLTIAVACVGCGSDSVEPRPRTESETWLEDHPAITAALMWDAGDGRGAQPYSAWSTADKRALHKAVSDARAATEPNLVDPPVNLVAGRLGPHFAAATAISAADARALYFGYVGRSLMLEMMAALPWSIAGDDAKELALLLDSRTFFVWKPNVLGTSQPGYVLYDANVTDHAVFDPTAMVSWVIPAPPKVAASFLSTNKIVGATRLETISRLLEWERTNMAHFSGAFTFANAFDHWQYSGVPPASRIMEGTMRLSSSLSGDRHWTAGCPGTNTFMTATLRAVNIPVEYLVVEQHATGAFPTEGFYLSHADDPYSRNWSRSTPPVPASELLVDEATYDAWSSPSLPSAQRLANIGRRPRELMVKHLTDRILLNRCADIAAGHTDRATSRVYTDLKTTYTLEELEALDLWTQLDAKIASLGGCTSISPL